MPAKKRARSRKKVQPHDAVFKTFFSDAQIAANYLRRYAPDHVHQNIDFTFFRKTDTAFVNGRFGLSFSDVLYETKLTTGSIARLLFLFEHKSYLPAQPVYLQLLDYLLQIWEDDIRNQRPLSVIIPVIVYHGKRGWGQRSFSDYFTDLPTGWQVFIPNFQYLLTDLSRMPVQMIRDLVENDYLNNLFFALKFAHEKRILKENLKEILNFEEPFYRENRESILLQTLTFYLIKVTDMTQADIKELNQKLPKPSSKIVEIAREIFGDEIPRFVREGWEEKLRAEFGDKIEREVREEVRHKVQEEVLQEVREEVRHKVQEEVLQEVREEVRHEERLEAKRMFIVKTLQKFPDWNDTEIADFVSAPVEFVRQTRQKMADNS